MREPTPDRLGPAEGRSRIAVITGSRAEFGILTNTLSLLRDAAWCDLEVLVAGMHLVAELGETVREVETHFAVAARVPMPPPTDTRQGMALAVSQGLQGFSEELARLFPTGILVLGDRTEVFAAALAAAYLGIRVAHIHGGDVCGNPVDDLQRDAISRIARLHFPATRRSADRLATLGVEGEVHVVGAPGLDVIACREQRSRPVIASHLGLTENPWVVVLHHSNPASPQRAGHEMGEVLAAADRIAEPRGAQVVILCPNNDAGHRDVLSHIRERRGQSGTHVFESLPRDDYLDLVGHSELLLGNSSSGVIESLLLGVRVINVGDRQAGRERDGNVIDAEPECGAIVAAASRALSDRDVERALQSGASVYGDGTASARIVAALEHFLAPVAPRRVEA